VLRRFAADEEAYIILKNDTVLLLDGSRGCSYAKCDFCGFNSSWCGYRMKSAKRIYALLTAVLSKYGLVDIQFSDNLCDAWVNEFCDLLFRDENLAHNMTLELRAAHDEKFYTKLSLAGIQLIQVGVEALSDHLLQKMNKGSTLIQNVQSMKYLKEVHIKNGANLIIHHPRSNIIDVKKTKDILGVLPHLGKLDLSKYNLAEHSAIYNALSLAERKNLKQTNIIKMPSEVFEFFTDDPLLPLSKDISAKVKRAWADFKKWYDAWDTKDLYLNVYRVSADTILIKDNRFGKAEEHVYSGELERIYTLCHKAYTVEGLHKVTGLETSNIHKILGLFVRKKLMISSNGRYLSVAVRPKEELINNYYAQ
jgi:radical SAM superfamily enzyme YgiQ (UPF0313 family)